MKPLKRILLLALLIILAACSNDDSDDFNTNNQSGLVENNNGGQNGNDSSSNNGGNETGGSQEIGNDGEITLYKVSGSSITKIKDYQVSGQNLSYQQDTSKHNEIWELIKKIVPTNYLSKMNEFLIYSGQANGTAGFVIETNSDLSKWKMGIAIDYAYQGGFNTNGELAYTIIHEFGHILTLNNDQLNASISRENCSNYYPGEGCANSDAYINKTYQNFWADIWSQYQEAKNGGQNAMQNFYNTYQDRFLTQYASTNPGEDIAEIFAVFVTRNSGANGSSKAEQKIQLFYNHSELVSIRNFIRGNLNSKSSRGGFTLPAPGSWKQANRIGNPHKKCGH
ncbi:hypothetical protein [Pseudofulvibacter geojedonensis]|uniref:Uncharacterized protein n=1 Tax=Pseudofulvibacter geojedonensis TaxID=1123758 RepID=A0ABW3I4F1_9FLAO